MRGAWKDYKDGQLEAARALRGLHLDFPVSLIGSARVTRRTLLTLADLRSSASGTFLRSWAMAASGAAITAIEMSRAPAGCEFAERNVMERSAASIRLSP